VTTATGTGSLLDALAALRDALRSLELGLEVPAAGRARSIRDELVAQVDDYLLPRLRRMDAPLLMVIGGSTGAGKSTLVNSLVGAAVSPAGVLRPTTRTPVLVCNPADLHWFQDDRILPGLPRNIGHAPESSGLELMPLDRLPEGLALLDAPDIDSVAEANRALAGQLLAAADSWLFVTTAARYADAVPWDVLQAARERGTALSLVLNRVPPEAGDEVPAHLREMLAERGFGDARLLVVPETELADDGLLPPAALAPVRSWLDELAVDAQARGELVRRTLAGALDSLPARVALVAETAGDQAAAADDLRAAAHDSYDAALEEVDEAIRSGSLLRGEVLARWYDVVGTGDVMRAVESRVGWVRDRVRAFVTGTRPADARLKVAVESSVDAVVHAAAERAAERAVRSWRHDSAGAALLADAPQLESARRSLVAETADEVRAWQGFVFEMVREEGRDKRSAARIASLGLNGAGLAVMLGVFAHTGGLTGAEVAVAGGTSALGQRLLEAIMGDQAVRALADRARRDLLARVEKLLDGELQRFDALLAPVAPSADARERVLDALRTVQSAR
jgi:hypothetical protein